MKKSYLLIPLLCLASLFVSCDRNAGLQPVMMLRLRPTNTDTDSAWAETYNIIKANPGCCDEVWFSTGMGFLPEEWHQDKAERMSKAFRQLDDIGVKSALQFQMTIGHGDKFGYGNEELYAGKTWRGWTGSHGVEAKFQSCPRNPQFMEYIRSVSRIYAGLGPSCIWVDDDLRYDNHKPASVGSHIGCWCDDCLAAFSERTGAEWSRESLSKALDRHEPIEQAWHEWCVESLCDIAAAISEEVHKVSLETKMAFQGKKEDFVVSHVSRILAVMHEKTGLPVGYRPGTGPRYDIDGPHGQIVKSMQSARFIELMGNPDYVDVWCPEIETWPRVYGSRTGQGVLVEGFAALAYGLNSVSMFFMAAGMEPAELYSKSLLRPISQGADVLKRYAYANEGTSVAGYGSETSCDRLYEFARTGVPVLPGPGCLIGTIPEKAMDELDIPKQLSSDIQTLREEYPAPAVCCSPFVGLLIPRITSDGVLKTVGVINTRIDVQEDIRIRLTSVPENKKYAVWHEMKKKPVRVRIERSEGFIYAVIPEIAAWNAGFLEF